MRRKVICLLLVSLFLLSNSALAANWVHFGKDGYSIAGYSRYTDYYLDIDSVVKTGDTIIFWILEVNETPTSDGVKKYLEKWEAKQPRMYRELAVYHYDSNNKELRRWPDLKRDFEPYNGSTLTEKVAEAAYKYAKEGQDSGQKPTLP